eukprot:COSAG04_NODE_289_length_17842_cov_141.473483_16_plen_120_part_00
MLLTQQAVIDLTDSENEEEDDDDQDAEPAAGATKTKMQVLMGVCSKQQVKMVRWDHSKDPSRSRSRSRRRSLHVRRAGTRPSGPLYFLCMALCITAVLGGVAVLVLYLWFVIEEPRMDG